MLVQGGQLVNFNYVAFDEDAGLFVAGLVYDVTSGSPVLVGSPIPMVDKENGAYVGSFTPVINKAYLIVMTVFTDATYATAVDDRGPAGANFEAYTTDNATMNFNYGAYDGNTGLTVNTDVNNLTDNTVDSLELIHVAFGIYYGQFVGAVAKNYLVVSLPTDTDYSPAGESFQCFTLDNRFVTYTISNATRTGQSQAATLTGPALSATLKEMC